MPILGRTRIATSLLFVATALGCGGGESEAGQDRQLELFSWWVSGSETQALQALLDVYSDDHPQVEVINAAAVAANDARADLQARMAEGFPPDTFQANAGLDMLRWVSADGTSAAGSALEPIDDVARSGGWAEVMPPAVLERITFQDKIYAVPVNVHRLNCLFYNKQVFADAGLTPPTNIDELLTVSVALRDQGVTPIALGSNFPWTVGLMVWENLIPALLGPEFYVSYLSGDRAATSPELRQALERVGEVFLHTNPDAHTLSWDQATTLVANGDAAMTFMGDWAKGEFTTRGLEPEVDFGMVTWGPDIFVFVSDTFVLPKGAIHRDNALDLLATMGSVAGQDAFNPVKGSIPSRTDVQASRYDAISQRSIADFASPTTSIIPARSMFVPEAYGSPVDESLGAFARDGNVDNLMIALENYYDVLK